MAVSVTLLCLDNQESTKNVLIFPDNAFVFSFHGQSPYYIASGTGKFTDSSLKRALKERKGKPYRRDTQVLFSGKGSTWIKPASFIPSGTVSGWFLLRMKAQTVGAFLIHCHIALHMTMGMMATLLIGIENLPRLPHEIVEEYMYVWFRIHL